VSVLLILIPLSVLVAGGFLGAFIWAVRAGQYEDTTTPSLRILTDDLKRAKERSRPISPPRGIPHESAPARPLERARSKKGADLS